MINNKVNAGILSSLVDIYTEGGIRRFYRGMAAELIGPYFRVVNNIACLTSGYISVRHVAEEFGHVCNL